MCNNHEEDQVHVLQECPALEELNLKYMENIFNEDINLLKKIVICLNSLMEKVQTDPKWVRVQLPQRLSYPTIWACTQR